MSLVQQRVQAAEPVYEDFEPPSEWVHDESSDTLVLMLPGFKKEQLKVQIASTRILRLSGERQISENKWRQFRKEFAIPHESDTSGVTAKFDNGMLSIKLPKHITPIKTTQPPPIIQQQPPKNNPQQPTPNAQPIQQNPVDKSSSQPTKTQNTTKPPPPPPTPPIAPYQNPIDKSSSQPTKTQNTTKPPPPPTPPIAPYQKEPKLVEETQKKQKLVEKTAEAYKDLKTKAVAALEKPKKEIDEFVKKAQKEKGKSEATTSRGQGVSEGNVLPKRSHTMEVLSRQTQEYKKAVSGLVEEVKKQKKMVNFSVLIILVLVFGFYVKNAIKSSLGGPKIEEL